MAHALTPIIHVGKAGVTDGIIAQADEALIPHELVKGTVQQNAPVDAKEALEEIVEKTGAEAVAASGRKFVLYRRNTENPKIDI